MLTDDRPVKKKGGTAAGVPRANDALPFPAGPKEVRYCCPLSFLRCISFILHLLLGSFALFICICYGCRLDSRMPLSARARCVPVATRVACSQAAFQEIGAPQGSAQARAERERERERQVQMMRERAMDSGER